MRVVRFFASTPIGQVEIVPSSSSRQKPLIERRYAWLWFGISYSLAIVLKFLGLLFEFPLDALEAVVSSAFLQMQLGRSPNAGPLVSVPHWIPSTCVKGRRGGAGMSRE